MNIQAAVTSIATNLCMIDASNGKEGNTANYILSKIKAAIFLAGEPVSEADQDAAFAEVIRRRGLIRTA